MKTGTFLCGVAVVVMLTAASATMGDIHTAQYKGATVCMMCHGVKNKPIVEAYKKSPHANTLRKADVADAIVADFSTNKTFTKDKVAFVLGKGRHQQAFLDAAYKVLPAEWDVKSKSWKAVEAVDGSTQCLGCHTTGFKAADKTFTQMSVGCEACHGPGGDHVGAPGKATIFNPSNLKGKQQAMVCGQCHSVGKDTEGIHSFPVGYRPGDDLSKSFVDAKPTSAGRNQQYSEFIQSKHAETGMVSCTTCHDPHNVVGTPGQLVKPINELCLGCHAGKVKDLATHAPKAAADATCATCHMPDGRHTFAKPGA